MKAASHRAERRRPLWTSRRCSSPHSGTGHNVRRAQQRGFVDAGQRQPPYGLARDRKISKWWRGTVQVHIGTILQIFQDATVTEAPRP